jgi:hypothetical protein
MKTEEMEDLIFGSTPDPNDRDGCLDDAAERQVRAEQGWWVYLATNPTLPELLGLLTRFEEELREDDTSEFFLDLLGSGLEHITERPEATLDELEIAFNLVERYQGEDSDK